MLLIVEADNFESEPLVQELELGSRKLVETCIHKVNDGEHGLVWEEALHSFGIEQGTEEENQFTFQILATDFAEGSFQYLITTLLLLLHIFCSDNLILFLSEEKVLNYFLLPHKLENRGEVEWLVFVALHPQVLRFFAKSAEIYFSNLPGDSFK